MPDSRSWLFVSKPVRSPFRDGSTVLVRDLVAGLSPRFDITYFGDPDAPLRESGRAIRAAPMGYSPGLWAKARVLGAVLWPGYAALPLHFFFTPNRLTSSVLRAVRRLQPGRPMLQSVMSSHRAAEFVPLLAGLDAVVVPSDHTRNALAQAGLNPNRIHRVYPGVELPAIDLARTQERREVLYAGDLDARVVDRLLAVARALGAARFSAWKLVVATRPKGPEHSTHRRRLSDGLAAAVGSGRAEILGEVEDMDALMRRAALQIFAADHVRKKVDLPLVLLEGLARGVPLISVGFEPVSEIFRTGADAGLEVGRVVAGDEGVFAKAVTDALGDPPTRVAWGRAGPELIRQRFSTREMIRQYEDLYDALGSQR